MMKRSFGTAAGARLVVSLLGLAGCTREPWEAFPERTPPDRSCVTGSATHGEDVYLWSCLRAEHVVVSQYSGEMFASAPIREVAKCGTLTSIETRLALTAQQCSGPREGRAWR